MMNKCLGVAFAATAACLAACVSATSAQENQDATLAAPQSQRDQNGHAHYDNREHPTIVDPSRFVTSRSSRVQLPLPEEKDAFVFAVFGDRTGGPPEGIEVLKQAVADANLFEPDLVMTVGDLVQGYNTREDWLPQMREYKTEMNKLLCPWFPVAGNHDVYWRGPNRPKRHHERNYEMHFGPLWYAFQHKDCWFIVLFSDEGNPETGEKSFQEPELQRMSPEQLQWLQQTLSRAKAARHVFLFLHHPRWLGGNYGDDWEKVHQALVEAGNVRAVFAGHIHQMRYDGPRDGVEYVTLATVGGGNSEISADAGFLHHYHLVTVRQQQIAMACLPVGEAMDVREITGTVNEEVRRIAGTPPNFPERPMISGNGASQQPTIVELFNPTSQPVEYEVTLDPNDRNWVAAPDHFHRKVYSGQRASVRLKLKSLSVDGQPTYQPPRLRIRADYLTGEARFAVRQRTFDIPVAFHLPMPERPERERAAVVGDGDYFAVEDSAIALPDGPLTLECWCKANSFDQRVGLVAKTQSSDYGIFVSGGIPYFTVHLGGRYVEPKDLDVRLSLDQWHHIAGVYDGQEVRNYVDGKLIAREQVSGRRRRNQLPLVIGGDVDDAGQAVSPFDGMIDAVRLSTAARYKGESFEPQRRWAADEATALLLNFDGLVGPFAYDESESAAHARRRGAAELQWTE